MGATLRALFVPYAPALASHGIPLIALMRMLRDGEVESALLVSARYRPVLRGVDDVPIVTVPSHDLRSELQVYTRFRPDVVVHDFSLTTRYAATIARVPLVSIVRTGAFPGEPRPSRLDAHSFGLAFERLPDVSFLGLRPPRNLSELVEGDVHVVPALPSIEPLPRQIDESRYIYSGPLLAHDAFVPEAEPDSPGSDVGTVTAFLDANAHRPIVYVTLGTMAVQEPQPGLAGCIRALCAAGAAIVTNLRVDPPPVTTAFLRAPYLPMHLLCARADLVVHHCGSGTYHYPILARKLSVTVGTGYHDREDVALRLQALGLARHVRRHPEPLVWAREMQSTIEALLSVSASVREALFAPVLAELASVQASFKLQDVLRQAVAAARPRARHA